MDDVEDGDEEEDDEDADVNDDEEEEDEDASEDLEESDDSNINDNEKASGSEDAADDDGQDDQDDGDKSEDSQVDNGDVDLGKSKSNQGQSQRESEKQRKIQTMFLNYKILEEKVQSTMSKFGIRHMDSDVLFMINDAIKSKYIQILQELISISRSSQSNSYLTNKNSQPREVSDVHTYNVINLQGGNKMGSGVNG